MSKFSGGVNCFLISLRTLTRAIGMIMRRAVNEPYRRRRPWHYLRPHYLRRWGLGVFGKLYFLFLWKWWEISGQVSLKYFCYILFYKTCDCVGRSSAQSELLTDLGAKRRGRMERRSKAVVKFPARPLFQVRHPGQPRSEIRTGRLQATVHEAIIKVAPYP